MISTDVTMCVAFEPPRGPVQDPVSRFDDVNTAIVDHETFSSHRRRQLPQMTYDDQPARECHRRLCSRSSAQHERANRTVFLDHVTELPLEVDSDSRACMRGHQKQYPCRKELE